jgi:predicted MPP superfamily phosphohydrolase
VGEILTARAPELLVSAGDVVTSGREYLDDAARALCGWKGSVASAGVLGDHDLWSAPERVREMQVQCGWLFLENEHRLLRLRGRAVCLTGLTHVYGRQLRGDALSRFLASAPRADLHILLTHQPAERVVDAAASARYDIVLAGHTHGGQIVLHPLGIPLTPSMRETRYVSGTYAVGSMTVVVTNGIGLTLAPIRYHAPAEVTSIVVAGREGNLTALP